MSYGSINFAKGFGQGWGMPSQNQPIASGPGLLPMDYIPQVNGGEALAPPAFAEANTPGRGFLDSSYTDKNGARVGMQGWGMPALGVAGGIFNAWMGMKQYGLAKKQLEEGQKQFGLNYDAQRTTTNTQLEDRQRARVASNSGAYESVGPYMAKNGIQPRG